MIPAGTERNGRKTDRKRLWQVQTRFRTDLGKPEGIQGSPACSLTTLRGILSSRSPANFECRNLSTYAPYCTPSWRGSPNHGPKDYSVTTGRNDSTTFNVVRESRRMPSTCVTKRLFHGVGDAPLPETYDSRGRRCRLGWATRQTPPFFALTETTGNPSKKEASEKQPHPCKTRKDGPRKGVFRD